MEHAAWLSSCHCPLRLLSSPDTPACTLATLALGLWPLVQRWPRASCPCPDSGPDLSFEFGQAPLHPGLEFPKEVEMAVVKGLF